MEQWGYVGNKIEMMKQFSHVFTVGAQAEFLDVARCNVEALNRALQEVPVEQVRVHVCWGNYAGPHHQEIDGPGVSGDVMKMVDAGRCMKM